jgi:acyl-CoA reductase-like NAD-dependent aldehyde dehydrogenase
MSIADQAQAHALLIDGQDVPSAATRTVHDPATGEAIAEVADASAGDAERAVAAARAAFRSGVWSRTESRNLEGRASGEYLEGLTSTIRREPIGVCASIAPWNHPLNMAAWKIGPALAAGNTVVLDVVPGPGPEVGGVLARHEDVAPISVTGSTRTGASVMREAAGTVKRVHMELGGKAPFVAFADADVEAAAERGGTLPDGPGAFYPPTVITGAAQDSEIVQTAVSNPEDT